MGFSERLVTRKYKSGPYSTGLTEASSFNSLKRVCSIVSPFSTVPPGRPYFPPLSLYITNLPVGRRQSACTCVMGEIFEKSLSSMYSQKYSLSPQYVLSSKIFSFESILPALVVFSGNHKDNKTTKE